VSADLSLSSSPLFFPTFAVERVIYEGMIPREIMTVGVVLTKEKLFHCTKRIYFLPY